MALKFTIQNNFTQALAHKLAAASKKAEHVVALQVAREIVYLNTGTAESPVWSPIGKRVEDSSIEMDWGTETKVDIFGDTYTTGKKATKTQTFDPCELDSSDAAQQKIWALPLLAHLKRASACLLVRLMWTLPPER